MQQIHLVRGYDQMRDEEESLVISSGHNKVMLSKARGVHFCFAEPQVPPQIQVSGSVALGALTGFSQGYCLGLPELEAEVFCGCLPWWSFPNFDLPEGKRLFYVPLRGWYGGAWYDGPLAHYSANGLLASFVPPGAPARLSIPWQAKEPSAEVVPYIREFFINESMKWLALRTSAAYGLLEQVHSKIGGRAQIQLKKCDGHSIVLLCLLRMACPDAYLECEGLPQEGDEARQWSRLCRNLDIRVHKDPRMDADPVPIEIERYAHLVPDSCLQPLFEALNHHSPLIPRNLLKDLGFVES